MFLIEKDGASLAYTREEEAREQAQLYSMDGKIVVMFRQAPAILVCWVDELDGKYPTEMVERIPVALYRNGRRYRLNRAPTGVYDVYEGE